MPCINQPNTSFSRVIIASSLSTLVICTSLEHTLRRSLCLQDEGPEIVKDLLEAAKDDLIAVPKRKRGSSNLLSPCYPARTAMSCEQARPAADHYLLHMSVVNHKNTRAEVVRLGNCSNVSWLLSAYVCKRSPL